jgi:hypothetical protein
MQATLPTIKAELSSLNSIYELKDFKSLPRLLLNFSKLLRRAGNGGVLRSQSLREGLRSTADGYLQSEFNIRPLVSDILGVNEALSTFIKAINRLLNEAGRPRRRHFTYTWQELPDGTEDSEPYWPVSPTDMQNQYVAYYLTRYVRNSPAVFHFEIEYNFNYTQYQRENALMLALLDRLGVNLNPQIIWNAIPWSFVVDWVLGVNRWLSQFKVANMEPQINIRRCLYSISRSRDLYMEKKSFAVYPQIFNPGAVTVTMPSIKESSYRRRTIMPGVSSIESSGLTAKEVSLGAALVLPKAFLRRKRWR